jgi:hypothetical protein
MTAGCQAWGSLSKLKTKRIRERAYKHPVAKAGGESSEALREPILHGPTPESLRPPHRLPYAEHRGVASSFFSFERDPHARCL